MPHFSLFGTPTLLHEGERDPLPIERGSQLVALLALKSGWVTRAEVTALMWPDLPNKLAYANLRKTLFRLQLRPWAAWIETQAAALRFNVSTDVAAFEAALAAGCADEALALYRGELLAGYDDTPGEAWSHWLRFERDRLRAAWRAAALERTDTLEAPAAVALTTRLLDTDPLDEAALRAHVQALSRDGQASAARHAYCRFADLLAGELGIEPDAQTRLVYESLSAPQHGASATSTRQVEIPVARSDGFVGRAVELQRIAGLLARDECRLLCVVGPGGVGKTRLARRLIDTVARRFADGAWFVELEGAQTLAHVGQLLADALGVRAGVDAMQAAIKALAERHALVVLDNIEHLIEHTAAIVEPILAGAPRVKLLVTSRVRLTVAGAWSMPLEGLPVPDPEDDDHAEGFDAVRMFMAAAQRVSPSLSWSVERAAMVDICRQLEGLPLALELAAAWTRVLSCADIATELRQGHDLLHAQDASQPTRHASIGVVFEESWRRLTVTERRVLARLCVFRGGFTAQAARAVAGAALPVLGALVDKSLLRKDGALRSSSGQARLALHPLLQQLAAAKLDDEGDNARRATELAHAGYFHHWLDLAWRASEQGQAQTLAAIETDFENCRQAWSVAITQGDSEALARSAPTLLNLVEYRARFEDGLALWLKAVDTAPVNGMRIGLLALLDAQTALIEFRLARFDAAQARAARALARTSHAASDRHARYQATAVLASCAMNTGRYAEARRLFLRTLALARALSHPHKIAGTLENLALACKRLGDYQGSLRMNLEALAEHRRNGAEASEALSLSNLASLEMFMGDQDAAALHLQEALVLAERHGLTSTHVLVRANLTELAFKSGDLAQARVHAERAFEIAQSTGMRAAAGWLELQLSRLAARRLDLKDAQARIVDACTLALELRLPSLKAAALLALAELFEAQDRRSAARRVLAFGAGQSMLSAPDRDELRAEWHRRACVDAPEPAWLGLSVDELLRRVVVEHASAHTTLIAELV